jgi:predicted transcriptional regulator
MIVSRLPCYLLAMKIDVNINAIDEIRFTFLSLLYKETLGYVYASTPEKPLGASLGLSEDETDRISVYLRDEGLIRWAGGGEVSITHEGLKLVENSIREPPSLANQFVSEENPRCNLTPEVRKQKRFEFLYKLYEISDGDIGRGVDTTELGCMVGIDAQEARRMASNLADQGLVWGPVTLSNVAITEAGVSAVEDADGPPAQFAKFTASDLNSLQDFVTELRSKIDALALSRENREDVDADISILESQFASSKPQAPVLQASLRRVNTVLEHATENVAAERLLHELRELYTPRF